MTVPVTVVVGNVFAIYVEFTDRTQAEATLSFIRGLDPLSHEWGEIEPREPGATIPQMAHD